MQIKLQIDNKNFIETFNFVLNSVSAKQAFVMFSQQSASFKKEFIKENLEFFKNLLNIKQIKKDVLLAFLQYSNPRDVGEDLIENNLYLIRTSKDIVETFKSILISYYDTNFSTKFSEFLTENINVVKLNQHKKTWRFFENFNLQIDESFLNNFNLDKNQEYCFVKLCNLKGFYKNDKLYKPIFVEFANIFGEIVKFSCGYFLYIHKDMAKDFIVKFNEQIKKY
jgi:hypothetical protein